MKDRRRIYICIYSGESVNAFLDHCRSPFHSVLPKENLEAQLEVVVSTASVRDSRKLMFVRFTSVSLYY